MKFIKNNFGVTLFLLITMLLIAGFISGCYSEKKATTQFNKAATSFPKLPIEYCADNFPVVETITKGDSIISFDTLYLHEATETDTLISMDTVRITTRLPGKTITKTIRITDTIYQENTAKIKSCEIDKSKVILLLEKKTNEADKWKGKAKKRGTIMWILLLIIAALGGSKIYSIIKNKKI